MESRGRSRMTMFVALLAIAGIADYLLNIAALHFLRPDVNPELEPISNYAVGPFGFLLTAADIGGSLAALALTLGLYLRASRHLVGPTSGSFSLVSTASPYCWQGSSRSMPAERLRRSAPSTTSSAT